MCDTYDCTVRDYRSDMKYLDGFITEVCSNDEDASTLVVDLYAAYKTYCDKKEEKSISLTKFGRMFRELGYKKVRETIGKKRMLYKGIKLNG